MTKHKFSHHAIQRWKERFPNIVRENDGNVVGSLAKEFYSATEYRAIINNTAFMAHVYDTYGTEKGDFHFYTSDKSVFICREKTVITLYDRDRLFPKLRKHNYKRKA
jgi:Ca2+-binding EF-hand superfamily protein